MTSAATQTCGRWVRWHWSRLGPARSPRSLPSSGSPSSPRRPLGAPCRLARCENASCSVHPEMKALPEGFDSGALIESLADGWDFDVETIEYAPVGFGSYHWVVADTG